MKNRFRKLLWRFFYWLDGVPPGPWPGAEAPDTVRYFVAYNFTSAKYLNGARTPGCGMSVVEVPGGIQSWEQILVIREHLERRCAAQDSLPHPQVTITNLIEIHRCKTLQQACPCGH